MAKRSHELGGRTFTIIEAKKRNAKRTRVHDQRKREEPSRRLAHVLGGQPDGGDVDGPDAHLVEYPRASCLPLRAHLVDPRARRLVGPGALLVGLLALRRLHRLHRLLLLHCRLALRRRLARRRLHRLHRHVVDDS